MIIRDMFRKPIDRDIKGVIKVGQADAANLKQELEEYVVTRELRRHFRDFFASYKRGILGETDKMGIWISGFFGSGKSHLLKILADLLANVEVGGKRAIDYFLGDEKGLDPTVIADMQLAASVPTDVILFNIDSKSEMSGKQDKDAIVYVFLKVFNEMLGFCGSNPYLADLERKLTADGRYEEFKAAFEESYGSLWVEARNDFDFIQDDVVEVLSTLGVMSTDAARNWCEHAAEPYSISIERFADLVRKYIESKGNNHHVVFLVDEIGQYIGEDSKLMLNLQTVTEDLGTACRGKAWIICTSQQDIDSITKTIGDNFSKIQGRFDTRLALSSANVDEVIRERILKKNDVGRQTLTVLYDNNATIIKNLILFNDGIEKKLYAGREDFAAVYPFIPYQFNLLGSVLTAIRTYGASGKHLAEGERSMLALFKDSAERLKESQPGTLVPFHMYYDALERFLDHSHASVISRALDNEYLNPDRAENCFVVNVLKTLFLIKYVKEIRANVENITTLMVSDIHDERLILRRQVEEALRRLERQTLIQKNGELYVFLTNEEQEINRAIDSQHVEPADVTHHVSQVIFDDLFDAKKYRHPALGGRYQFPFNTAVDEHPYKSSASVDITVRVLTPASDEYSDEYTMKLLSSQSRVVLVVLPEDRSYLDETRMSLKIENFLRFDTASDLAKFQEIKVAKQQELTTRRKNARLYLQQALSESRIYVGGDLIQSSSKDVTTRINEALGKLIQDVYHKLSYIDTAFSDSDILKMLKSTAHQISLSGLEKNANQLARDEVLAYISHNSDSHSRTSMKSLTDRFMKAPYGFIETDVQWLVARLFKDGYVDLFINSEPVSLLNRTADELLKYITRKENLEKLMIDRKVKPKDKEIKAVREVMKAVFNVMPTSDDDDAVMQSFMTYAGSKLGELNTMLERCRAKAEYPGEKVIKAGRELMLGVREIHYTAEFYAGVCQKRDDYLDFADDYEPVKAFYSGEQKGIFDKSLMLIGIYDDSKSFIADRAVSDVVKQIRDILRMPEPYNDIFRLPELNARFTELYDAILDAQLPSALSAIQEARERVFGELQGKRCHDRLSPLFIRRFEELKNKAESTNNVATLHNIPVEADALKLRMLNEIMDMEAKLTPSPEPPKDEGGETPPKPAKPVIRHKLVSIKTVNTQGTWQLKTEADVDAHLAELRKHLVEQLGPNTIVNVEF